MNTARPPTLEAWSQRQSRSFACRLSLFKISTSAVPRVREGLLGTYRRLEALSFSLE